MNVQRLLKAVKAGSWQGKCIATGVQFVPSTNEAMVYLVHPPGDATIHEYENGIEVVVGGCRLFIHVVGYCSSRIRKTSGTTSVLMIQMC